MGGFCVPNAQHAVRQGKLLAKNIVADLRGEGPTEYMHKNSGAVAGLGVGVGVFQSGKFAIKGLPAWLAHRGYHGLAMPSWERKIRVIVGWVNNFFLGRDIVSLKRCRPPVRRSRSSRPGRSPPSRHRAPAVAVEKTVKAPRAPRKTAAKVTEPVAEQVAEPVAEKVAEPVTEKVTEKVS